jgi:hypothetical protein
MTPLSLIPLLRLTTRCRNWQNVFGIESGALFMLDFLNPKVKKSYKAIAVTCGNIRIYTICFHILQNLIIHIHFKAIYQLY